MDAIPSHQARADTTLTLFLDALIFLKKANHFLASIILSLPSPESKVGKVWRSGDPQNPALCPRNSKLFSNRLCFCSVSRLRTVIGFMRRLLIIVCAAAALFGQQGARAEEGRTYYFQLICGSDRDLPLRGEA